LSNLPVPSQPVTVMLDGQGGTYPDQSAAIPNNVKLTFNHCNFVGQSPALTAVRGQVSVLNSTFTTGTDAPTILVSGGSLTLRNDIVQESTCYTQADVRITGG